MSRTVLSALLLLPWLLLAPLPRVDADEEAWRKRLAVSDADELFQAIRTAGEKKDPAAAFPLLEAALDAKFPHLAIACGEALQAMAWPGEDRNAAREAERWIDKTLKGKEELPFRNLAGALAAWGHALVDEPLAQLASGRRSPGLQAEALMVCALLEPTEAARFPKVKDAVKKALDGRSDEVKVAACSAAARIGDASFFEDLVSLVKKDTGEYPGLYGVWALTQLGYKGGLGPFLHVLTGNPKKTAMQANLKALAELATTADLPELLARTRDSKKDIRDAATLALGRLTWRGGFGRAVTTGESPRVSAENVPPEVIERLVSMVETETEWEVRDAARQGLIRIGDPAKALVQERLPKAVEFSDEDTRLTAIELCGLFGASAAYKDLYKTAIYDKSRTVRMFASRALQGVDAAKAVEELSALVLGIGKTPRDYEINGIRALGYIRHPGAMETLLKLIESQFDDEQVMREVEYALERLTGHRFGRKPDRWRKWLETAHHPLHPMVARFDRSKNRREAVEKGLYGLSRETERAVENGLRWLELQQHTIGLWDGNEKGFGGVVGCEPAYTGLSLLAFVGAGYGMEQGKYRETIRRAVEFLAATQFYDGGFPVTGGGDDSWIFAYLIAMGIWGVTETYALTEAESLKGPAQWGLDYLARVQTAGAGWRYGPRYVQSDTSCTSWVLMTLKAGDLVHLSIPQRSLDGIDSWLERCSYDVTGEEEVPDDLSTDYDYEVGSRRYFKAFTGYFELSGAEKSAAQQTSMTAAGMVCRFFMGWKRSHPYMIGCANYLMDYLPTWMKGLEKGQAVAWYHYFWYYGTLAMHQMGGRYWRAWNDKIKRMYTENQRTSPAELYGSWDPDTAVLNGGRLFSTAMSVLSLQSYYRFSPLLGGE